MRNEREMIGWTVCAAAGEEIVNDVHSRYTLLLIVLIKLSTIIKYLFRGLFVVVTCQFVLTPRYNCYGLVLKRRLWGQYTSI